MKSPYEQDIRKSLDSVALGIYDRLERLNDEKHVTQKRVVTELLGRACEAQHIDNILLGRKAIGRIPVAHRSTLLDECIPEALDLGDEWEYRRVLELLEETAVDLLPKYIALGKASMDPEIREAASEVQGS